MRRALSMLPVALIALGCASQRDSHDAGASHADPPPVSAAMPVASTPFHAAVAPTPAAPAPIEVNGKRCREQSAQDFLLRKGQIAKPGASAAEQRQILAARRRSIEYRTREYGHFPGFGSSAENAHPPRFYGQAITFMGVPVVVNRRIVPALQCVEAALKRDCADHPYQPAHLSGMRFHNTYKDYEVSNHVYGIALDVDPEKNPCCQCVGKWAKAKICKKHFDSLYDEMAMPRCWVKVFERYGFHWLGHDEMHDTMHFEFLGDPEPILE